MCQEVADLVVVSRQTRQFDISIYSLVAKSSPCPSSVLTCSHNTFKHIEVHPQAE